jgi:hypothetical protein
VTKSREDKHGIHEGWNCSWNSYSASCFVFDFDRGFVMTGLLGKESSARDFLGNGYFFR